MASVADELDRLEPELRRALSEHGFDRSRLIEQAARLARGETFDNRVAGRVEPPRAGDVVDLPEPGSAESERLTELGIEALARNEVALIVLAGGMATRMRGVVKALVEALPGRTFLDLRLAEMRAVESRVGRRPPLWLMTSHATDAKIRQALGAALDGENVAAFAQHLSLRLTENGNLYRDGAGRPSEYAPGHGDLPDALRDSSLIRRFVERGGRVVMVANLDNLGATIDPLLVGFHLDHRAPATCEVVDKLGSDRGGIPVRLDGRLVVLEEFRLPAGFDADAVRVFNSNTFLFDARALFELSLPWTFFCVKKKVDDAIVVQFERLIGEVTSHLDTRFLRVPRQSEKSRFLPVKDPDELEQRRAEIVVVARTRGMIE